MSIYSVQMVRNYNGTSKQYSGDIEVWLRSPHQIEYVVNGDFYNNGATTITLNLTGGVALGEYGKASFSASESHSSNHFKYFYDHQTKTYTGL